MTAGRRCRIAAALALGVMLFPLITSTSKAVDPAKQREEQRKIQARVDEAALRASSTLDAMRYQRLPMNAEQKMLREVADGLKGLSQEQINEVLAHLEKAVMAPDPKTATEEQKAAYQKHLQIVQQLKVMLGQLDVIKNLDEAAERLERAAEKQIKLITEAHTNSTLPLRRGVVVDDRDELAIEQGDMRAEVASVFKQVAALINSKLLNPEQMARVEKAEALTRGAKLVSDMAATVDALKKASFIDAGERQRRHAKELKDLAAALRTPPADRLSALINAKKEVEKAIDAQTKVNKDTAEKPDQIKTQPGVDPKTARANELANQQTKAEFATRDARKAAEQVAPEVADKLKPAETQQWKAEDKLRIEKDIPGAQAPQEKALEALKGAKDELDRQIAAAQLAKTDPLAATKQAIEQIDKIIQDQKDTNTKTDKAAMNPDRTQDAANAQKDVAKKTDDLRNTPLPSNNDAKQALDRALDAQKNAAEKLDNKQPNEAKPKQQDALAALEKAKDELEKQAKAIEERRAEIAKLEELKNKLDELTKNEKEVAKAADKAANDPKKPETGDIAKKQGDLTDPTKQVGQDLEKLVPEAAQKVGEANMKQEGAKNDLAMNMPMMGGEKAKDAADKLGDAAKDVQKKLDEKKGQEAADQAALQPNKVDPQQAAQQLAKAIEQANMAAQQAMMAQMALNPMMMDNKGMPDLAQIQKDIAKKAADQMIPEAAKAADMAAKALEMGDLPKAIMNQQKALDELNKAGMQPMGMMMQGMMGDMKGMMQPGMMQPGMMGDMKGMQPGMMGMQPGDMKGMQPGMMGMQPGDMKGMQPGMKGMQPGDMKGMQPGMMGMQPGDMKGMQPGMMGMQPGMMGMGMMGMGMMGMGGMMGMPNNLAQQQQQVLDATKALQQSQQANAQAQAALQQAQANAPMAVQPQLQQAQNQLQQAQNQLQQGQPGQAGMNQQQAAQNLQQALDALNQAAMMQGMMGAQPGMGQMAMAGMGMMGMGMGQMGMGMMGMGMGQMGMGMGMMGMGMGQMGMGTGMEGMGMGMGMGMMGMGMGMAQQGMNMGMSEGDMNGGEKLKNANSTGNNATGDGNFIKLRNKDRDKVQQTSDTQFPAEFRELIKQYNINIKNGKPATSPPK